MTTVTSSAQALSGLVEIHIYIPKREPFTLPPTSPLAVMCDSEDES